MTILVIKNYQRRSFFIVPFSLAVAVFGFYLVKKGPSPIVGWAIVALFGFLIPAVTLSTSDDSEKVVIDDTGIFDRALGVGKIHWSDVMGVHLESKYNNHYLCFKVKNPDIYLSRMPERLRQKIEYTRELGFTHFNIDVSGAGGDVFKLLDLVQKKIERNSAS